MIISDYFQIINRKRTKRRTTPSNMAGRWSRSELWYAIWRYGTRVVCDAETKIRKENNETSFPLFICSRWHVTWKKVTYSRHDICATQSPVRRVFCIRYFVFMRTAKRRSWRGASDYLVYIYLYIGIVAICGIWRECMKNSVGRGMRQKSKS